MNGVGWTRRLTLPCAVAALLIASAQLLAAQADPLPSWNDEAAKKAIVDFVVATTTQGRPTFVPPAERIAAFDLYDEKPALGKALYRASL